MLIKGIGSYMKSFYSFIILGFVASYSEARSDIVPFREELQSDRPDFTEGAFVVDRGHFQVESGYTYSSTSEGRENHVAPEMLLRLGAFDTTEIRIYWEGYQLEKGADGASGYSLGFKTKIAEEGLFIPRTSLNGEVGPGDPVKVSSQIEAGIKLLLEKEILGQGLAGNLNLFRRDDGVEEYFEGSGSLTFGFDLSEVIGLYLETYAILPFESSNAKQEYYFDGGFTILAHDNLQLDIRSGLGLNNNSDEMFVGTGFVYRR